MSIIYDDMIPGKVASWVVLEEILVKIALTLALVLRIMSFVPLKMSARKWREKATSTLTTEEWRRTTVKEKTVSSSEQEDVVMFI